MIRLISDGLEPLVIDDWAAGYCVDTFDLGWPNTRAVATDRPGGDGTIDETQFVGARAVSANIQVVGSAGGTRRALLDRLYAFLHPGRRVVMEWLDPSGGDLRSITLRAEQSSAPMDHPSMSKVTVSWVAPSGLITSAEELSVSIAPMIPAPGLSFNVTYPVTFPFYVYEPGAVTNVGTMPANWRAMLYGPLTGPSLLNRTTGQRVSFPGLVIAAGDYLELDSLERTARVNGVASATRYAYLDFTASTWWQLGVGTSLIEFSATSSSPPAFANFLWRDTFIA